MVSHLATACPRKLRLLAVACCYHAVRSKQRHKSPPKPRKPQKRPAYEAVVGFADGTGSVEEVRRLWQPARIETNLTWPEEPVTWAESFADTAMEPAARTGSLKLFPDAAEM